MIAVTGANGLLGSSVVRKLYETKTPFVALKRKLSDTTFLTDLDGITWRDVDILDPQSLQEAFEEVDGVIHAAAIVSFNPREEKKIMRINVEGTKNVVNACLSGGVKRLLHISSVSALGRQKDQTLVDESNMWKESSFNTGYGESKYKSELEVFRGQEEGLSTVMVNPSVVLARGNWTKSSAKLFNYAWKERPFYANGCINYVDVRDVANLVYALYSAPYEGERFIINAGTVSIKDFFDELAALFQKKGPRLKVSKGMLHAIARIESLRCRLTGSEPLITKETARLADTFFLYDNTKVKKAMGYEFQPLSQTLTWCAEFYRKQMEIKNKI